MTATLEGVFSTSKCSYEVDNARVPGMHRSAGATRVRATTERVDNMVDFTKAESVKRGQTGKAECVRERQQQQLDIVTSTCGR